MADAPRHHDDPPVIVSLVDTSWSTMRMLYKLWSVTRRDEVARRAR